MTERRTQPYGDLDSSAPTGEMDVVQEPPRVETQPFTGSPEGLAPSQPTEGVAALDVVAGFHVQRKLGEGGMATVFEAVHVESGKRVALKRVKEAGRGDKQFTDRFLREVKAAGGLDHPHICKVIAGGQDGAELYLAVELLEGGDLERLLKRMGGKLPAAAATVVVCELLEALAYAHEHGVVHRDIKPANVMLSSDGAVKLVDFGIARAAGDVKLTATGLVVGTPSYMSPEQARGQEIDGRSDLFSVGVLLIELLTGSNPFFAETATATVMKILLEAAPPLFALDPTAPGVLHHVAGALLERDAARRYPSARAALDDLLAYRHLVETAHPHLLRDCLDKPDEMKRILQAEQAQFERDRAADLVGLGAAGLPGATLALVRALHLEPTNADARRMLEDVCRRAHFNLQPVDERLRALDDELAKPNAAAATWRRAADLQRAAGNPPGQARCLSYYLQRQPTDEHAARQWQAIVSGPPDNRPSTKVRLSTREIVDGIRTGGWKAASSSTELFTGATPVQRGQTGVDLDVARRPRPTASATARPGMPNVRPAEPSVVFVGERDRGESSSGRWLVAGAGLLLMALAISVIVWSTKQTVKGTERVLVDATSAVNVEDRTREQTQQLLGKAREALAARAGTDALEHANQALRFSPSITEAADAHFIKARARALDQDDLGAQADLRRYFDTAPANHKDLFEAKALASRLAEKSSPSPRDLTPPFVAPGAPQ